MRGIRLSVLTGREFCIMGDPAFSPGYNITGFQPLEFEKV